MLDFTVDEDSYVTAQAAIGFADMIRPVLADEPNVNWVDRQQLNLIKQELSLSMLGQLSAGGTLSIGAMSCADLAIMGNIGVDTNSNSRKLTIDIVDLRRADVLATRVMGLSGTTNHPLSIRSEDLQSAVALSRDALRSARRQLVEMTGMPVVAPLFLHNGTPWDSLDAVARQWTDILVENGRKRNMRVLRFPKAMEAADEAGTAFFGYSKADADRKNWLQLADVYAWGGFDSKERGSNSWENMTLTFRVVVCNANGDSTNLQETCRIADLDQVLGRVASVVLSMKQSPLTNDPSATRKNLSSLLCNHLPQESASSWGLITRAYQLAHFFDPLNEEAWWQSIVISAYLAHRRVAEPVRQLRETAEEFKEWTDYNAVFGLKQAAKRIRWGGASTYVMSAAGLLGIVTTRKSPYLREMPEEDYQAWRSQIECELVQHTADFMQVYDPNVFSGGMVNLFYTAIDQIQDLQQRIRFIELLWDAASKEQARGGGDIRNIDRLMNTIKKTYGDTGNPTRYEQLISRVSIPESSGELRPRERDDILIVPRLNVAPADYPAAFIPVIPNGIRLGTVSALQVYDNRLWVAGSSGRMLGSGWGGHLHQHRYDPSYASNCLLVLDPQRPGIALHVESSESMPRIDALFGDGDTVWVAFTNAGIRHYRSSGTNFTSTTHRAQGLADVVYTITKDDQHDIYVGGISARACSLSRWSAGQKAWIPMQFPNVYGVVKSVNHLCAWDNLIICQSDRLIAIASRPDYQWKSLSEPTSWGMASILASAVTREGLWLGSEAGLALILPDKTTVRRWTPSVGMFMHAVDPQRQTMRRARSELTAHFRPKTRLPGSITTLVVDGDFLWMGVTTVLSLYASPAEENFLMVLHRPTKRWVASTHVPGRIRTLAADADRVWLGLEMAAAEPFGTALLSMEKKPFLSRPPAQWVSDTITDEEIQSCIASMATWDQAKYAFYLGDFPKAIRLLEPLQTTPSDREVASLFLGWCYDRDGLNQPGKARSDFEWVVNNSTNARVVLLAKDALERLVSPTKK